MLPDQSFNMMGGHVGFGFKMQYKFFRMNCF